nr:hypothetical protein [Tanacetum cinerariifolium]
MSSYSSHATVTYTFPSDSIGPSLGILSVDVYGYECDASEAASRSPKYAPLSQEHALPTDDDLEQANALLAPVLPALLSPDYSEEYKPIKNDPQKANPEEDPDEEPFEEEERVRFSTPPSRFEIRESSTTAIGRQLGSTLAQGTIDILMVVVEETNGRVTDLGTRFRQDSHEMAAVTEYEAAYARDAWCFAMDMIRYLHDRPMTSHVYYFLYDLKKMAQKRNSMSAVAIEQLIEQRVTEALAAQENNRYSGNPHNSDSNNIGGGERTTRHYTYKDFLNLKYATCTLLGSALTWWNSHVMTVGYDATYGMPWKTLMKMMMEAYYPRKLAFLCSRMVFDESGKVEKYVRGLPNIIQGNVMSAKPKTLQEVIKLATSLMDQKVHNYAARQADNKRRMDNNPRDNNDQLPPFKRKNMARAY